MGITIYRGFGNRGSEMGSGDADGQWWTTDSLTASSYGRRVAKAELKGRVRKISASKIDGLFYAPLRHQVERLTELCGPAKALLIKGWHGGDEITVFVPDGIDEWFEVENELNY